MTHARPLAAALAASALAFAGLLAAAPAAAADLPEGATLSVVDDDSGTIYDVNAANADLSPAGAATNVQSVTAIDVNATGQGYALTAPIDGPSNLYVADAAAGTLTDPIGIIVFGDILASGCAALDYTDGVLVAACLVSQGESGFTSVIGVLNPETGVLESDVVVDTEDQFFVSALAKDPTTGILYAFDNRDVFTVDLAADTITPLVEADHPVYGADFDVNGVLWITTSEETGSESADGLATLDLETGEAAWIGFYETTDGSDFSITNGITVWGGTAPVVPEPALAATGSETVLPIALGALLLVLAGLAFAATSAISRRTA
jgi:hypothetical protein